MVPIDSACARWGRSLSVLLVATCMSVGATLSGDYSEAPDVPTRTLYFSARDAKGIPIADITKGDLALFVNGRDVPIVDVQSAREPIDASIIVNDAGTGVCAGMIASFVREMSGYGRFSIFALDQRPIRLLDSTEDMSAIESALRRLGRRTPAATAPDVVEAVNEAANDARKRRAARPVIVVMTTGGERYDDAGTDVAAAARAAIDEVERSHASLHVLMGPTREVGLLFDQGTRQSGGSRTAMTDASLAEVARTLLSQYALTYVAPDAKKTDTAVVIRTSRALRISAPQTVRP